MAGLVKTKYIIKRLYSKYEAYINPILKFVLALILLLVINNKIGFMSRIDNIVVVLILSLMCSFLPLQGTAVVAGIFMMLHLYALGVECALVMGVLLLLMMLLFVRFVPNETIVLLLTPVLFFMGIPYVMPIAMGLIGTPLSIVSVSCGVVIANLLMQISSGAEGLSDGDLVGRIRLLVSSLIANKTMFAVIIVFVVVLLVVYAIRRMPITYAWTLAIAAGVVIEIVMMLMVNTAVDSEFSVPGTILGTIVGGVFCLLLQFLNFHVDYERVETLQFEDDDYYYYVKAVPKITASSSNSKAPKYRPVSSMPKGPEQDSKQKPVTIRTANGASRIVDRK